MWIFEVDNGEPLRAILRWGTMIRGRVPRRVSSRDGGFAITQRWFPPEAVRGQRPAVLLHSLQNPGRPPQTIIWPGMSTDRKKQTQCPRTPARRGAVGVPEKRGHRGAPAGGQGWDGRAYPSQDTAHSQVLRGDAPDSRACAEYHPGRTPPGQSAHQSGRLLAAFCGRPLEGPWRPAT